MRTFRQLKFDLPFEQKSLSHVINVSSTYIKSDIVWYNDKRENFPITLPNFTIILPNQKSLDTCSVTTDFLLVIQTGIYLEFVDADGNDVGSIQGTTVYANYNGFSGPCIIFSPTEFSTFEFAGIRVSIFVVGVNPSDVYLALNGSAKLYFVENMIQLKKDFKSIAYRTVAAQENEFFEPDNYITIETKKPHELEVGDSITVVGLDNADLPLTITGTIVEATEKTFSFYQYISLYGNPQVSEERTRSKGYVYQ